MTKHYFYAIDTATTPAQIHRFPTMKERLTWVDQDPDNREEIEQKANHPVYWQVRRINRMLGAGKKVVFPFVMEG